MSVGEIASSSPVPEAAAVQTAHGIAHERSRRLPGGKRNVASRIGIGLSAVGISALLAGCGADTPLEEPPPSPTAIVQEQPTVAATATASGKNNQSSKAETPINTQSYSDFGKDLRIGFNGEHLPLWYRLLPEGSNVFFDPNTVRAARNEALATKEPVVITEFTAPTGLDAYTREHPATKELPKDALSQKELSEKGVTIIQSDNTELFIRRGAFEKDQPLEQIGKSGKKLTIVLVDGPILSSLFMESPKYDLVRSLLPSASQKRAEIDHFRQSMLSTLRQDIGDLRGKRAEAKRQGLKEQDDLLVASIFEKKRELALFEKGTFTQVAEKFISSSDEAGGQFFPARKVEPATGIKNTDVAFVVTGDKTVDVPLRYLLFFDQKGEVGVLQMNRSPFNSLLPTLWQTNPDPNDFKFNKTASPTNPQSFPYGVQTPGFGLRHELEHGSEHARRPSAVLHNEYDMDMRAMQTIRDAWQRWVKSGFKDNSGYHFVFRLPDKSGFILTGNKIQQKGGEFIKTKRGFLMRPDDS